MISFSPSACMHTYIHIYTCVSMHTYTFFGTIWKLQVKLVLNISMCFLKWSIFSQFFHNHSVIVKIKQVTLIGYKLSNHRPYVDFANWSDNAPYNWRNSGSHVVVNDHFPLVCFNQEQILSLSWHWLFEGVQGSYFVKCLLIRVCLAFPHD